MLTYFLIIFVVVLALAPLLHFLPSKWQRRAARMREYAATHGMYVEFRKMPGAETVAGLSQSSTSLVMYYGKRFPPATGEQVTAGNWVLGNEGWRSVGKRLPVPDELLQLPSGILGAGIDRASCGVYWTESSGPAARGPQAPGERAPEQAVEQIRQVLERWSEAIIR